MNDIMCPYCGCEDFFLQFSGEHIKAICKRCGKILKGEYYSKYINYIDRLETNSELATENQLQYIRYLSYHKYMNLTKEQAGDIIGIFNYSNKEGVNNE